MAWRIQSIQNPELESAENFSWEVAPKFLPMIIMICMCFYHRLHQIKPFTDQKMLYGELNRIRYEMLKSDLGLQ